MTNRTLRVAVLAPLLSLLLAASACARSVIPNTDVEDTEVNREVIGFVEQYRKAVQARDVGKLLSLASRSYYDDHGTPDGHDDLDYESLRDKLARWRDRVQEARYEIRYRRVHRRGERIFVDYTFTASYKVRGPQGESRWERRLADNRLVLVREGGSFKILSGM